MSHKASYRRHSPDFKGWVRTDICVGKVGRLNSQKLYKLPTNLIQDWLVEYLRGHP